MQDRREIEQVARNAGPWTTEDEEAIAFLRDLATRAELTEVEQKEMAILRQREINESVRRRNELAVLGGNVMVTLPERNRDEPQCQR